MATNPLELEFSARLRDAIGQSYDLGYPPIRFEKMLDDLGAIGVARKLIVSSEIHDGMKEIAKLGRRDLIMESIMLDPKFKDLFSASELAAAAWRLSLV